jgi:hypothetical protein
VVDVTVIAMWAHPRAVSTAFLRMMIERGDVTVIHEPLVTLTDFGEVALPDGDGATVSVGSAGEVLEHVRELGRTRTVFFKDTVEYRYEHLYQHPEQIAGFRHTFIVRDPAKAIASHYAMKPTVACHEIGFEHQYGLFELAWRVCGDRPVVVSAERLLAAPEAVVRAYCAAVGLEFRPEALQWAPEDRAEWSKTRQWHVDASASSGFQQPVKDYRVTVENDERLRSFDDYHRPFYDRLIKYAL